MQLLSIGEFSRLTGLSVKTLHWYDEQGLIRPAWVDEQTKYRFYNLSQVDKARQIQKLRQARMPLALVLRFLQAGKAEREALLVCHQTDLEREVTRLQQAISHLERLQGPQEEIMFEVTTREVDSTPYLRLSLPLPVPTTEEELKAQNAAIMQAWQVLCRCVGREYMRPDDVSWLAFLHADNEHARVHVCLQLNANDRVSLVNVDVVQLELPQRREAVVERHTSVAMAQFEQVDLAWESLLSWLEQQGLDVQREVRHVTVNPHEAFPVVEYVTTL